MVSIVIPTLNEEQNLAACIRHARATHAAHEIIVVDGGSTDRTTDLAVELGATVLASHRRQRAGQMNLGASHASGDIFLFLHADTKLPAGGLELIEHSLKNARIGGGAFARHFDSRSVFLKCTCALAEARGRAFGWHLGDQAIFVRKSLFERLNGFKDCNRFEDLDFSRRLRRIARTVTLRPPAISSARRFERGAVRVTCRDLALTLTYLCSRKPP